MSRLVTLAAFCSYLKQINWSLVAIVKHYIKYIFLCEYFSVDFLGKNWIA